MTFSRRPKSGIALVAAALAAMLLGQQAVQGEEKSSDKTRKAKLGDITLEVPESWKQADPKSRLRVGEFTIPPAEGDQEPAELAVFFFGGAGGGAKANVERWIGQFEQEGREARLTTGKSPQGDYTFVDVKGTYNKPIGPPILRKTTPVPNARMLAVILAVEDKGNYFLKLTGPQKTVTAAADAFRQSFGGNAKTEKEYKLDQEN